MYSPIPLSRAEFVKYLKHKNKDDRKGKFNLKYGD